MSVKQTSVILQSFPPLTTKNARLLILGSMPGAASLAAGQYYAHPRNAFWHILQNITGIAADAPYEQRSAALKEQNIALWDVLRHCRRSGSLDSAISHAAPNDFAAYLKEHAHISRICFNGAKAEQEFHKYIRSLTGQSQKDLYRAYELIRLPSTSPAHAAMSFEDKKVQWLNALRLTD